VCYKDKDVRSTPFRQPNEVLSKLVTAGVELIHARDPALGAALDVPPPSVAPVNRSTSLLAPEFTQDISGLAYRGVRKIYRSLKRVELLQPALPRLHDKVRRQG